MANHSVDARAAEFVGHDMGAVDLHARLLEAQPLDIADDTDRRNHCVELFGGDFAARFEMRCDLALCAVEFLHGRLLQDLHPLLFELFFGEGRDVLVLDRKHAIHHLDDRRVGAQSVVKAREFNADGARSNDQQLLRHPRRHQSVAVGPDQIAVGLQPRQLTRPRAGGDDDVFGGQRLGALVGFDLDLAFARELGLAHDRGDFVLFKQALDAAIHLRRDAARALDDGVEIKADVARRQTEFLGAVHLVIDLGRAQQRLRRDAAPVQTNPAQIFALDTGHLEPQLRRTNGGHIATRAGPYHDEVERCVRHGGSSRNQKLV